MAAVPMLLLGACASYSPHPLDTAPRDADLSGLARDASSIDRPFLRPVSIDLGAPLDANALGVIAVLNNPDLIAMRAKAGVADAQAFSARLLPDPTFNLGFGHILQGEDPVDEIVAGLGFDLAQLRTSGVRRHQAEAQARQVRLDILWSEWQTVGQVRLQVERIQRLTRQVALLRLTDAGTQSLLARTARAAGRGDVAADALQSASIAAAATRDKLTIADRDLGAARYELNKLLGLSPNAKLALADPRQNDQVLDATHLTQIALASRADLQALQQGYGAQEAALRKAILDQFPTLALNLNFTRDTGDNRILGPTVDFTLPLWNRNRGGIAIERATRDQLHAEYKARVFQTRADVAAAVSAVEVARRQAVALRPQIETARSFAEASRRAADRGDLALSTAEIAESALADKQVELAAAEQQVAETMIALELLTGVPREDW